MASSNSAAPVNQAEHRDDGAKVRPKMTINTSSPAPYPGRGIYLTTEQDGKHTTLSTSGGVVLTIGEHSYQLYAGNPRLTPENEAKWGKGCKPCLGWRLLPVEDPEMVQKYANKFFFAWGSAEPMTVRIKYWDDLDPTAQRVLVVTATSGPVLGTLESLHHFIDRKKNVTAVYSIILDHPIGRGNLGSIVVGRGGNFLGYIYRVLPTKGGRTEARMFTAFDLLKDIHKDRGTEAELASPSEGPALSPLLFKAGESSGSAADKTAIDKADVNTIAVDLDMVSLGGQKSHDGMAQDLDLGGEGLQEHDLFGFEGFQEMDALSSSEEAPMPPGPG